MISEELYNPKTNMHMVQFGVWPDCTNNCEFCLRLNRKPYTKEQKIFWLNTIAENIKNIDWKNKFSKGISLLGGELYYIKDKEIQAAFLNLIDVIIEYVLKPGEKDTKYSSVTNGIYKPDFLYSVIDKIVGSVGISHVDLNFSYDLKYRYKTEKSQQIVIKNINEFRDRYDYKVGVQMILTQYVIDLWKSGKFEVNKFIEDNFPGCSLSFLYPHKIRTKHKALPDFFFKRLDFLKFISYLKKENYEIYLNFVNSTKNSSTFKYTGLRDRRLNQKLVIQQPMLADGKEYLQPSCKHSTLYNCYADSSACMLCDLQALEPEI